MTRREIISVGPAWATESGNKVVVPSQEAYTMLGEMRKAYAEGYRHGRRSSGNGFFWGVCCATLIWVLVTLFARAL